MADTVPDAFDGDANVALWVSADDGVLANDTGVDASATVTLATGPEHGEIELRPDGSFTYIPTTGYWGTDTFSYTLHSPDGDSTETVTLAIAGDLVDATLDLELSGWSENPIHAQAIPLSDGGITVVWAATQGSTVRVRAATYDAAGVRVALRDVTSFSIAAEQAMPFHDLEMGLSLADLGEGRIAVSLWADAFGASDDTYVEHRFDRLVTVDMETGSTATLFDGPNNDHASSSASPGVVLSDGSLLVITIVTTASADFSSSVVDQRVRIYDADGTLRVDVPIPASSWTLTSDGSDVKMPVALPDGKAVLAIEDGLLEISSTGAIREIGSGSHYDSIELDAPSHVTIVGSDRYAMAFDGELSENSDTDGVVYQLRGLDGHIIAEHRIRLGGEDEVDAVTAIAALDDGTQLVVWSVIDDDDDGEGDDSTAAVRVFGQVFTSAGELKGERLSFGAFRQTYADDDAAYFSRPWLATDGEAFLVVAADNQGIVVDGNGSVTYGPFRLTTGEDPSAVVRAERTPDGRVLLLWGSGARIIDLPLAAESLFTTASDVVDFNHLTPEQSDIIERLSNAGSLLDAKGGDDTVMLPDFATPLPGGVTWDFGREFNGGAGDDIVIGGTADDIVNGGADDDIVDGFDGDDTIKGSTGNDHLIGGEDEDLFDFSAIDFQTFDSGTFQNVYGHELDDEAQIDADPDTIWLPGSPNDYRITTDFEGYLDGKPIHSRIELASQDGPIVVIDTVHVEKAIFTATAYNTVGGNALLEMARLAIEAYGPRPPLLHFAEELASHGGIPEQTADITNAAERRGWHPLSAIELGMPAAADDESGLSYSLTHGHYQAKGPGSPLLDTAEANAIVLVGVVEGELTLALTFRGTDQIADFGDYASFSQDHYTKFRPLIDAIDAYCEENGITRVLVSGHSLGAAMVQEFMASHDTASHQSYRALTVGSPGSENDPHDGNKDERILNIVHTDDPVAMFVPGASSVIDTIQTIASMLPSAGVLQALAVAPHLQGKVRDGSNVYLNSEVADRYVTGLATEHSSVLYLKNLTALLVMAGDIESPFYHTDLAADLRAGANYSGSDLWIAIGDQKDALNDVVRISAEDQYALAGDGDDRIDLPSSALGRRPSLVIDGGTGKDTLILPGFSFEYTSVRTGSDRYDLFHGDQIVATLARVEHLTFAFGERDLTELPQFSNRAATPSSMFVVNLDGTEPVVQRPTEGAATATLAADIDYFDAGSARVDITGTAAGDKVLLGSGMQSLDAKAGADIIAADPIADDAEFGALDVSGGAGDDLIFGDAKHADRMTARYSGERSEYRVSYDDGAVTIIDLREGSPDGTDRLRNVSQFAFSDGEFGLSSLLADNKTGTAEADYLGGDAGDDILRGLGEADLIFGGEGADTLYGDDGDDFLHGGEGDDLLEGGAGVDSAAFSGTYAASSVTRLGNGSFQVANAVDGTDMLTGVEVLRFADRDVSLLARVLHDVDGDGDSDVLYYSSSTGRVGKFTMENGVRQGPGSLLGDTGAGDWDVQATGDVDGDGQADIVLKNATTGQFYIWTVHNGVQVGGGNLGTVGVEWDVRSTGDFNGDGVADLLWRDAGNGHAYVWTMDPSLAQAGGASLGILGTEWDLGHAGDFDGDGDSDVLLRNGASGQIYIYSMQDGVAVSGTSVSVTGGDWTLAGTGDFNGDGRSDIALKNAVTGDFYLYQMDRDLGFVGSNLGDIGLDWDIASTGDYNADGTDDIFWRNGATGQIYVWQMDNGRQAPAGSDHQGFFNSDLIIV